MPSNYKKQPQSEWIPRYPGENRWPDWKLAEVLDRYKNGGTTITAMSREFGVSYERMRQVLLKAMRNERHAKNALAGDEVMVMADREDGQNS